MPTRVLLVDPDEAIVDAFSKSLVRRGFEVLTASNERDCMRHVYESAPDVVVLEPDTYGVWGHKLLDSQDEKSVPAVVVSRLNRDEFDGMFAKANCWLTKPIKYEALAKAISRAYGG